MENDAKRCIYCGAEDDLTADHVPPKNLFPSPRPSNLLTVPACGKCNSSFEKDDEYFRLTLIMREDLAHHPDVQRVFPRVAKSLSKPTKRGFRKGFLEAVRFVEVQTSAGIILGRRNAMTIDTSRLKRVVERVTRALFYVERDRPLPPYYKIRCYLEPELPEGDDDPRAVIVRTLLAQSARTFGDGVFSYRYDLSSDDESASAWLLVFYERAYFICLVVPED